MSFLSVSSWKDSHSWSDYLQEIESILGDQLFKLDENDPVRRKVSSSSEQGPYITAFPSSGEARMTFGVFKKTGISFSITIHPSDKDPWGRSVYNSINFYGISAQTDPKRLEALFNYTTEKLHPFYAFADLNDIIKTKKSSEGGAIDIELELVGVFWLTYFCEEYIGSFSKEGISTLADECPRSGIRIKLAESPSKVAISQRVDAETLLGGKVFAGTEAIKDFNQRKTRGFLPLLESLRH